MLKRSRNPSRCALRAAERLCITLGIALATFSGAARVDSELGRAQAIGELDSAPRLDVDTSLWSAQRTRAYRESLAQPAAEPVAILRVPAVHLEVPVYATSTELNLNRGSGLIEGMGLPDKGGNVGIAGHRDGFFRVLKDVRRGDLIELRTRARAHSYRVTAIEIVAASDRSVLVDTQDPSVTLVTCYPFYYVGNAPRRFVVRGTYEWNADDAKESHPQSSGVQS